MTGRHLHSVSDHGVYETDDPGPAPGSRPVCPICGTGQPPDLEPVDKPPGYLCRRCGWHIAPEGGRLTKEQRELWAEETKGAP